MGYIWPYKSSYICPCCGAVNSCFQTFKPPEFKSVFTGKAPQEPTVARKGGEAWKELIARVTTPLSERKNKR